MSFSVVGSVNHLVAEYRRFLLSTYRLADPRLREQFESHIKQADVLVKGPYVTLANDFAREHTLKQLHELGVGHKDLQRLKWSFGENELFLHQEQSLRRVETLQRVAIVKTGTGSGKTEAFMLAVMSGVLKMRAEGVKGTKVFLLYPMIRPGQRPTESSSQSDSRFWRGGDLRYVHRGERERGRNFGRAG